MSLEVLCFRGLYLVSNASFHMLSVAISTCIESNVSVFCLFIFTGKECTFDILILPTPTHTHTEYTVIPSFMKSCHFYFFLLQRQY